MSAEELEERDCGGTDLGGERDVAKVDDHPFSMEA